MIFTICVLTSSRLYCNSWSDLVFIRMYALRIDVSAFSLSLFLFSSICSNRKLLFVLAVLTNTFKHSDTKDFRIYGRFVFRIFSVAPMASDSNWNVKSDSLAIWLDSLIIRWMDELICDFSGYLNFISFHQIVKPLLEYKKSQQHFLWY